MIFTYNYNIYVFSYVWITVFRYEFKNGGGGEAHSWKNSEEHEIYSTTFSSFKDTMDEVKGAIKWWLKQKKCKHNPETTGKWTTCTKCDKHLSYNDK